MSFWIRAAGCGSVACTRAADPAPSTCRPCRYDGIPTGRRRIQPFGDDEHPAASAAGEGPTARTAVRAPHDMAIRAVAFPVVPGCGLMNKALRPRFARRYAEWLCDFAGHDACGMASCPDPAGNCFPHHMAFPEPSIRTRTDQGGANCLSSGLRSDQTVATISSWGEHD